MNKLEIKNVTVSSISVSYIDSLLNRTLTANYVLRFMTIRTVLNSPSSRGHYHIYVAIYHHHLHIVSMSEKSFGTLEYSLHMINFELRLAIFKYVVAGLQQCRLKAAFSTFKS